MKLTVVVVLEEGVLGGEAYYGWRCWRRECWEVLEVGVVEGEAYSGGRYWRRECWVVSLTVVVRYSN